MALAMQFEREDGWTPADVSAAHDGSGFDIRSVRRNAQRRHRGPPDRGQGTQHRHGRRRALPDRVVCRASAGVPDSGCTSSTRPPAAEHRLVRIQDPFRTLRNVAEISQITGYRVPAASIEERA